MIMQSYFKNDQEESCWAQSPVAEEAVKSQWGMFEVVHEDRAKKISLGQKTAGDFQRTASLLHTKIPLKIHLGWQVNSGDQFRIVMAHANGVISMSLSESY